MMNYMQMKQIKTWIINLVILNWLQITGKVGQLY